VGSSGASPSNSSGAAEQPRHLVVADGEPAVRIGRRLRTVRRDGCVDRCPKPLVESGKRRNDAGLGAARPSSAYPREPFSRDRHAHLTLVSRRAPPAGRRSLLVARPSLPPDRTRERIHIASGG
jgi:hypothetical protein